LVGLIVFVIISSIGISYTGSLWVLLSQSTIYSKLITNSYSDYLPINTSSIFNNTGGFYNVTKILTPEYTFDLAKYQTYSPMFLAPCFFLNYGFSFAALTAAIVHTTIFYRKEVWYRFKAARDQEPDIHMKLMKKYAEALDWWYVVLLVVSLAFGLATVLGYSSQLPCKLCQKCQSCQKSDDLNRVGILRLQYHWDGIHSVFFFFRSRCLADSPRFPLA
jgi:hypothetical protein